MAETLEQRVAATLQDAIRRRACSIVLTIPQLQEIADALAAMSCPEGWRPIETADRNTPVILYSPPENLSHDPRQEPDIRIAKPRDFCWATKWMPSPPLPAPDGTEVEIPANVTQPSNREPADSGAVLETRGDSSPGGFETEMGRESRNDG
jgi:hypothetical protein